MSLNIALTVASKAANWLRNLFSKIELWPQPMLIISLRCDSAAIVAVAKAIKVDWIRHLFSKIEWWPRLMLAIISHCESEATVVGVHSNVYNGMPTHISLRHTYVWELILDGTITVVFLKFGDILAYPLTNTLPRERI